MFKKIFALVLCFCLCTALAGCKKGGDTVSSSVPTVESEESKPVTYINPLTGEDGLDEETALQRPVAIMVNNISIAQPVQTGLTSADIVYETEVEGGITRLLAVYKDLKSVSQIGTVRSARYVYIDLAAGHDAVYVHHGQDETYAKPHFGAVDRTVLGTENGGVRLSNGLSSEHTLYAYGDKLWATIKKSHTTTLKQEATPWQSFADAEETVTLTNPCTTVTVPFSNSYKSVFKYNATTGRYTRYFGTTERKDYKTGESVTVKNVFVLNTTITDYSDGYHRKVALISGSGYYFVNGTYTKIKWSKGNASDSFKFTNEDGTPLTVNAGNSWVCISDAYKSLPILEG